MSAKRTAHTHTHTTQIGKIMLSAACAVLDCVLMMAEDLCSAELR